MLEPPTMWLSGVIYATAAAGRRSRRSIVMIQLSEGKQCDRIIYAWSTLSYRTYHNVMGSFDNDIGHRTLCCDDKMVHLIWFTQFDYRLLANHRYMLGLSHLIKHQSHWVI